jgi:hypothetical protein
LAEPAVASRSFPDAVRSVQTPAAYARKIFMVGLKLSGRSRQAAATGHFMQVVKVKKIFGREILYYPNVSIMILFSP